MSRADFLGLQGAAGSSSWAVMQQYLASGSSQPAAAGAGPPATSKLAASQLRQVSRMPFLFSVCAERLHTSVAQRLAHSRGIGSRSTLKEVHG